MRLQEISSEINGDELSAAAHATEMETMDVAVEFVHVDDHHG